MNETITILRLSLIVLCVILTFSCAHRMPPPGGPVNRTPPSIIETDPVNGSTQFKGGSVRLRFDQYVDERSVEESIFISPYVSDIEFKWSGKEVEIVFNKRLRPNTTYVINVGTDVIGYYTKTRMAHTYTLAFSTGHTVDRGVLAGKVYPRNEKDQKSGIMVYAYYLDFIDPDTLNPSTQNPDFITQTGSDGSFKFTALPWGTYRIFAIRDEYRNLLYDPEVDDYGVCSQDFVLSSIDSLIDSITIQLFREDTTAPALIKAEPVDNRTFELSFSESIVLTDSSTITITDTLTKEILTVHQWFIRRQNPKKLVLRTQPQDSTVTYNITIGGITDSARNVINPNSCSVFCNGSSIPDTIPLRLESITIKDSTTKMPLLPSITLVFSDAIDTTVDAYWIELIRDTTETIPTILRWDGPAMVAIESKIQLQSLQWYTLAADFRKLKRWDSTEVNEKPRRWRFQTLDSYELGSIEGNIISEHPAQNGSFYVKATQTGRTTETNVVPVDHTGRFLFSNLKDGFYLLSVFKDVNNNGHYDGGKPFPFHPSERLYVHSDTLRVRPRWPLEGVKLLVPF